MHRYNGLYESRFIRQPALSILPISVAFHIESDECNTMPIRQLFINRYRERLFRECTASFVFFAVHQYCKICSNSPADPYPDFAENIKTSSPRRVPRSTFGIIRVRYEFRKVPVPRIILPDAPVNTGAMTSFPSIFSTNCADSPSTSPLISMFRGPSEVE